MRVVLDPHQEGAVAFLSKRKRALVVAPAGSGKTIIGAAALARALSARPRGRLVRVGWMANTREQVEQAQASLAKFDAISALAEVHVACAAADTDWSDRDVLVVDETHHLPAEGWLRQVERCRGAVWGLTATPEVENEERDEFLVRFFDHCVYRVNRDDVRSRLVKARVRLLPDFEPGLEMEIDHRIQQLKRQASHYSSNMPEGELYRRCAWQAVAEVGIVGNAARNAAALRVASEAVAAGSRVLILANWTEHCEFFVERLGPQSRICHAKLGKKKRREALAGVASGEVRALVATSLADEGLDLPALDTLVLVSGGRSRAKAEQRTGRVLRSFAGKAEGLIYDFLDQPHPLMRKHSLARQALYRELEYTIEYPA